MWHGRMSGYGRSLSSRVLLGCWRDLVFRDEEHMLHPANRVTILWHVVHAWSTTSPVCSNFSLSLLRLQQSRIDRLRSSNCNSVTIAFAGASHRAVLYFTLSVGVSLHRAKSTKLGNAEDSACSRILEHQNLRIYCFLLQVVSTQCAIFKAIKIIALFIELALRFLLMPNLSKSSRF